MAVDATLAPLATALFALVASWFALGLAIDAACPVNARWLARRRRLSGPSAPCRPSRFLVIVPTIGERSLSRTLDNLAALEVPAETTVEVAIVGPANTARLRRGWHHFAPLDTTTGKPERLNHALAQLVDRGGFRFDYVVIVDSDTVVASDLLVRMADAAASHEPSEWPLALQPLVVSEPRDQRLATRVDAAMHTRWRLGFELSLLRLADRGGTARRPWAPASYAVGCCLAVRADRAARGFPGPCEDLSLGYQLSFEGLATAPVPSVAVTTTKTSWYETAERNLAWWDGSRRALRDHRPASGPALLFWALERARLLAWVPGPSIFAVGVALQLIAAQGSASMRVGAMMALALGSYAGAGLGMVLSGSRVRCRWTNATLSIVALTTLSWVWAWVPSMILVSRSLRLRGLGSALIDQLAMLGALSAGDQPAAVSRSGSSRRP
jgi:hypothetical protein